MADTREKLVELLNNSFDEQYRKRGLLTAPHTADDLIANGVTVQRWIPVTDRLPEEHDSIFAKFFGTERWINGMFRTTSNDVIACVEYEDGTRDVRTMRTIDGKWNFKGMGGGGENHPLDAPAPTAERRMIMNWNNWLYADRLGEEEQTIKPHTNADRIRAMSDEELAEWHETCPHIDEECTMKGCVKCILEWLQQPAEGE